MSISRSDDRPDDAARKPVVYTPIGTIHSPYHALDGVPNQPFAGRGVAGSIDIFPEYVDGLVDLEGFGYIVLLFHFHMSHGFSLRVTPFYDDRERGVFATRAPARPNGIGLSVVRLVGRDGAALLIEDVDVIDGTPLLDVKPYIPMVEEPAEESSLDEPAGPTADGRSGEGRKDEDRRGK